MLAGFCISVFLFVAASQGFCGITLYKQSYRALPGSKVLQSRQLWTEYYQGNKIAVYQSHAVFITDLNSDTLINISLDRKIYSMDPIEGFLEKMQNLVKKVRAQLGKNGNHSKTYCKFKGIKITKLGKTKKIAGYSCRLVEVFSNGKKVRDVWVTRKLPVTKEIDLNKAREKERSIKQVFCDLTREDDLDLSPAYQKIFKGGGVAMRIITYDPKGLLTEEITKVVSGTIPDPVFKVPEGCKKVPIEGFMRHGTGK